MREVLNFAEHKAAVEDRPKDHRPRAETAFDDVMAVLDAYSDKDAADAAASVLIVLFCGQAHDLQHGLDMITQFGGYARQHLYEHFRD